MSFDFNRTLTIRARPATVWRFVSEPEQFARWWGPGSTIEARVGAPLEPPGTPFALLRSPNQGRQTPRESPHDRPSPRGRLGLCKRYRAADSRPSSKRRQR